MSTAASVPIQPPGGVRLGLVAAVIVAVALVAVGLAVRIGRPAVEPLRLASMAEGAQAMERAGTVMQAHGQAMLDEGRRTGDQDRIAHGEHWRRDGQALVQGGRWMAMNPTAPGSLAASQQEVTAQGSWGELSRTAQAMLHDPSRAQPTDLAALRWAGLAMRAEGQAMAEHGRVMAEEAELMVARHGLTEPSATELRQAARTMGEVGDALARNGQAMIDYAEQLRRSLGYR